LSISFNERMYSISPYTSYLLYLYEKMSDRVFPQELEIPNDAWCDYVDSIYLATGQYPPVKSVSDRFELPVLDVRDDNRGIMIGFSGGRDSTLCTTFLQELGYRPVLMKVKGVNKAYPGEVQAAQRVADKLNAELIIQEFAYSGKADYVENPVKNHLILAMMIQEMYERDIFRACLGVFPVNLKYEDTRVEGVSDNYERMKLLEKAIQYTFPRFRFVVCFEDRTKEFLYLVTRHRELMQDYQSCMTPDRYRKNLRKHVEEKYGIKVAENMCLSCWKCCIDYLHLSVFGFIPLRKDILDGQVYPTLRRVYARGRNLPENSKIDVPMATMLDDFMNVQSMRKYCAEGLGHLHEDLIQDFRKYNPEEIKDEQS